jgi:transposase
MLNQLVDVVRYLLVPLSARTIAASVGVSKTTVGRYARLLDQYGLPDGKKKAEDCSARELSAHFNRGPKTAPKPPPDFDELARRLEEEPGQTLRRLHAEYAEDAGAEAMGYVQFTRRFSAERKVRGLAMRRAHPPGYVALVDYSGKRPSYIDKRTGDKTPVELFVGVLGHSGLTFARCSLTQSVPDWLDAHTKMLEFFGGAPLTVVPDNLKSAVVCSGKDPTVQRLYLEWGRHYGVAVLPARPGKPRDKGQVEKAVLDVQRHLLPELARRKFYSIEELNERIAELMTAFNERPFQKREGCRRSVWASAERSALKPLPKTPYTYAKWLGKTTVPADYHVPVCQHFYSVPHTLVGKKVEARIAPKWVELFFDGQCVAKHARSNAKGGHTTDPAHQHEKHKAQERRTPDNALAWAASVGPGMKAVMAKQFAGKVPLQGLPSALALWDLERTWARPVLEKAAARALSRRVPNFTGVRRMLTELHMPDEKNGRRAVPLRSKRKMPMRSPRKLLS